MFPLQSDKGIFFSLVLSLLLGGQGARTWGEVLSQGQTVQAALTGVPKDQRFSGLRSTAYLRSSLSVNCNCFFLLHANITVANTDSLPTAFLPGRQPEIALPCLPPCCCIANCHPPPARCRPH